MDERIDIGRPKCVTCEEPDFSRRARARGGQTPQERTQNVNDVSWRGCESSTVNGRPLIVSDYRISLAGTTLLGDYSKS